MWPRICEKQRKQCFIGLERYIVEENYMFEGISARNYAKMYQNFEWQYLEN